MDKRDPEIEGLLLSARNAGIAAVDGRPATRDNLAALAAAARDAVLVQAEIGLWGKWGIASGAELAGLRARAEIERAFIGSSVSIRIRWDWTRTPLTLLETY